MHVYNRCDLYSQLGKIFSLDSSLLPNGDTQGDREKSMNQQNVIIMDENQ